MAYDEKTLKRDGSGITPVPQHFNPTINDYEPIYGRNNAGRVELYGPDGNPISTSSGKLAVRATEIESLLNDIKGKDFATQTTLAAILEQLGTTVSAAVTDPTASAALIQLLKGLLKQLQGGGTGAAPVQLTGSYVEEYETLTVDATVGGKGFTAAKITGMTKAFITCETAQVRFTLDGTAPTTTVGHLLNPGDILRLDSAADLVAFRAIRTGATSGVLQCSFGGAA